MAWPQRPYGKGARLDRGPESTSHGRSATFTRPVRPSLDREFLTKVQLRPKRRGGPLVVSDR